MQFAHKGDECDVVSDDLHVALEVASFRREIHAGDGNAFRCGSDFIRENGGDMMFLSANGVAVREKIFVRKDFKHGMNIRHLIHVRFIQAICLLGDGANAFFAFVHFDDRPFAARLEFQRRNALFEIREAFVHVFLMPSGIGKEGFGGLCHENGSAVALDGCHEPPLRQTLNGDVDGLSRESCLSGKVNGGLRATGEGGNVCPDFTFREADGTENGLNAGHIGLSYEKPYHEAP